jgi:hypothetical protein
MHKNMWCPRTEEAIELSKKNNSTGNLDSNLNFATVYLDSFGPGMVGEVNEAF